MTQTLRLVFMGTPDFAVPSLESLLDAGHAVMSVYCQPPKPAGRGQGFRKTPVHIRAEPLGITVRTPKSLRDPAEQKVLADLKPDAIVVAAYGLILPQAVLDVPRLGCLNIHGSLLPRWRGAAPIHRALLAGDTQTGITIMQMDAGLDTGPMLLWESLPITRKTTGQSLHDSMAALGARLIVSALEDAASNRLRPTAQPTEGVTYADKLTRADGRIDWTKSAEELERQIRALYPWPGSFFTHGDETIKVAHATRVTGSKEPPGTLLDDKMTIACGADALRLDLVQREGRKTVAGDKALRGLRMGPGARFT